MNSGPPYHPSLLEFERKSEAKEIGEKASEAYMCAAEGRTAEALKTHSDVSDAILGQALKRAQSESAQLESLRVAYKEEMEAASERGRSLLTDVRQQRERARNALTKVIELKASKQIVEKEKEELQAENDKLKEELATATEQQQVKKGVDIIFTQAGYPTRCIFVTTTNSVASHLALYAEDTDQDPDTLTAVHCSPFRFHETIEKQHLEPHEIKVDGTWPYVALEIRKLNTPASKRKFEDSKASDPSKKQKV